MAQARRRALSSEALEVDVVVLDGGMPFACDSGTMGAARGTPCSRVDWDVMVGYREAGQVRIEAIFTMRA